MRASIAVAAIVALGIALSGCAGVRTRDHDALRTQLQRELDGVRERGYLPGVTGAVLLDDNSLLSMASGYADEAVGTRMPSGAVMPAGSVGKQFVAAVALALEHERRINLDVTIDRWFRDVPWYERVPNAHAISLRMLLMHRSGLPDHRESAAFRDEIVARFAERPYDPDFRIAPERLVSFVLDAPALFAAGQGFRYSETGYILAGMAIERACGCSYYQELERRFLTPLGLTHTRPANVRSVPGLVQGQIGAAIPEFPPRTMRNGRMLFNPATEWTGGGLFSNVDDLVRWSRALYEGRAMTWPYLDELLRGDPALPAAADSYGLGVRTQSTPLGTAYGHAGEFPGYLSFVCYFPDHRTAVALQTNTASATPGLLRDAAIALMRIVLAHAGQSSSVMSPSFRVAVF
jgi:D-alanyl-D-alanine carboxypeptidase